MKITYLFISQLTYGRPFKGACNDKEADFNGLLERIKSDVRNYIRECLTWQQYKSDNVASPRLL